MPNPPATDSKKPATPPPARAGAEQDKAKAAGAAKSTGSEKGAKDSAAQGSQQRFDRMAVRAKLSVSEPGDAVEREADRIADHVMRKPETGTCSDCGGALPGAGDKEKIARAADPAAAKHDMPPPIAAGAPKPVATGGTKGGLATEAHEAAPRIQRKEAGRDDSGKLTVPADFPDKLGAGESMNAETRAFFENRLGRDLSQVRIHTGADAQRASAEIHARAFTFGNHVAFALGQYQPDTEAGRRLLAHELAHVAQQEGQTVARQIMREPATSAPAGGDSNEIALKGVAIPSFKLGYYKGSTYKRKADYKRSETSTKQKTNWNAATKPAVDKLATDYGLAKDGVYVAVPKKGPGLKPDNPDLLVGGPATISEMIRRPKWKTDGTPNAHDIDHKIELQIGGPDYDTPEKNNLELRDAKANQDSGRNIDRSIIEKLKLVKDKENGDPDKIRASPLYTFVFSDFADGGGAKESSFYQDKDINDLKGTEGLNIYDPDKAAAGGGKTQPWPNTPKDPFFGGPNLLVLYPSRRGGAGLQLKLTADGKKLAAGTQVPKTWIAGFELTNFDLTSTGPDDLGRIDMDVVLKKTAKSYPLKQVPIRKLSQKSVNAGFISTDGLVQKLAVLTKADTPVPQSSPVEIDDVDILPGTGLTVTGRIIPSLPMLQGTQIDFAVSGASLEASKTFTAGEVKLPGPFQITGSDVTIAINTATGFAVTGGLYFAIKGLGEGALKGTGKVDKFGLSGEFVFDKKLFDGQAVLKASYIKESETEGRFKGEADLAIGNKIKGIKRAKFHALVDNDKFEVEGTADTDVPGLKQATVGVKVESAEKFTVTGSGTFEKLPGIESGSLDVTLARDGEDWALSGTGTAVPDLPGGINASIAATYDKGMVVVKGLIDFKYGRDELLKGQGTVVVTNAATVDDRGEAGGVPGKSLKAFGHAALTAKLGPVSGTIDLNVKPSGQIEIGGTLQAQDQKLFGQYPEGDAAKHNLAKIATPHIPLVGVPFVGINLWAEGSVDANASVGPGMLKGIQVTVAPFNPATFSIDSLSISGGANLEVPAQAGLSVTAAIVLAAELGPIQAGADLHVTLAGGIPADPPAITGGIHFTWSNSKGLDVVSKLAIATQPQINLSLVGKLFARADLCVDTITLWERNFPLADAKYDLPININASAQFGWNSISGFHFDPQKDIVIPKPELSAADFMNMLDGKPKVEKTENKDKDGKPIPDDKLMCVAPPREQNFSSAPPPGPPVNRKSQDDAKKPEPVDESPIGKLGTGIPLDAAARVYFEQRMGADLSAVRLYTGPAAAREAEKLSAKAFTIGEHIAFGQGQYRPDSSEGQELIAHELAHVVQYQTGGMPIVLRWPAVTHGPSRTGETPATIRAMTLSDFSLLTQTQLDWATAAALQADAGALTQFRGLQAFADKPDVIDACGDLGMGGIAAKGVPAVFPALSKYTEGASGHPTAWLRRTDDVAKAERWGRELMTLEGTVPSANLALIMKAPDPVANPSPFESLENPAAPQLADFITYVKACTPVLSAEDGSEVWSYQALRSEGAMPESYRTTVAHVKNYHHFTKATLDGLADNEAFPQWQQNWAWTRRPLTVVLYPAIDHNHAFHRNVGLQEMVQNKDILTIVIEGMATVADYQAQLAPVAKRYGIGGEIRQALIGGHGNTNVLQLAGTAGAAIVPDSMGTAGAAGTNTKNLMAELTKLMSTDVAKRRVVLDACLTDSHDVTNALRATPADAAADVNNAIAANPSLRKNVELAGATVFGADASFAPAQTTFLKPGTTNIGLGVPGDPDLIAGKLQYVEFGTEPEGCMRALLESWAIDQIAGTHDCLDAVHRRIAAGHSTHVAATDTWRENIIQPLYKLAANTYWGNGEVLRLMGHIAEQLFMLYWPHHTDPASLDASLAALTSAADVDQLLTGVSGDPHYATPRVALVIEQAWMQHTPARRANFMAALGRYGTCLEASADIQMGMVMAHVPALLTLPAPSPPPADQLRLALLAAKQAPLLPPPPVPLPAHIRFLRDLLGAGPLFPAGLGISAVLGGFGGGESGILDAIGKPLQPAKVDPRGPPPDANIDTIRDATARNDFHVASLRRNGLVATVKTGLMVRSTPTTSTNANIFAQLANGTAVTVIGEFTKWYVIEQPGRSGFVAKAFINLLP